MHKQVAVYGGSFDPPAVHHQTIVRRLAEEFDEVIVVPCGPRPDKPWDRNVEPVYRAAMNDLSFAGIERVIVDLFDLEQATFTRTHELHNRYASRGEIWHVVGADLIDGGRDGHSFIQTQWERGPDLWQTMNFAVVSRPGYEIAPGDLPPKHRLIHLEVDGSTATIRDRLARGIPADGLLPENLSSYVNRYELYKGRAAARTGSIKPFQPRAVIFYDRRNPKAARWAERLRPYEDVHNPNCVLVIGGDGTMNDAIELNWRRRLPFFGINAGHLGFLMNDAKDVLGYDPAGGAEAEPPGEPPRFPPAELMVRQMPMIYTEMQLPNGTWRESLTFNDVWLERATGQSAWLRVVVNGKERIANLICDGLLLSTPAASTAYASAMGAPPLLADTAGWLMVGSNVMSPRGFKSALLSLDAQVEVEVLTPEKRPVEGFVRGTPLGEVRAMRARISRIAAVELAYLPDHDLAEKIALVQFPKHASF